MKSFGKRMDGLHGRREDCRTPLLVPAAMLALSRSGPVTVVNVSRTGARLRGSALPDVGEDALIRAGRMEAFGKIVWNGGDLCGMQFDCCLSGADLRVFERQTEAVLVTSMTPKEAMALADWSSGFAR